MTKSAFDKIKSGLDEAKGFLDGSTDKRGYRINVPTRINVKKIRAGLGLSQESFAQLWLRAVHRARLGARTPAT